MPLFTLANLLFDHFQFTLILGSNIPGSYAIFFFRASDFTFTTRYICSWALFPLWLSLFVPFAAISLLLSSSILGTYQPAEFIFQCHIFLPFRTVHGDLKARMLKWFAILPDQGSNLGPLHWELRVLATGPPGKSLPVSLCLSFYLNKLRLFRNLESAVNILVITFHVTSLNPSLRESELHPQENLIKLHMRFLSSWKLLPSTP